MTPSQKLGANIRFHRKLKNLTQAELAEMLFVTAQSLSKWETGLANPDIWNLYRLSEIFGVSCDRLIGKSTENTKKIMIAVDGGGTKTEFLMFDEDGEILGHALCGTSNPNVCGVEGTLACLKKGLSSMLSENANANYVFLGIAGCGLAENRKAIKAELKQSYAGIDFEVNSDLVNVIYTNEISDKYISVICGTGSSVGIKDGDEIRRIGGYGYLFDKTFCGFHLGKEAISMALLYRNGLREESVLTREVEKTLAGNVLDKLNDIYERGNKYIASFSGAVFDAFDMGDEAAKKIIEDSVKALSEQILYGLKSISPSKEVIISGGLTARADIILPILKKYCPGVNFSFADMPQIYGSAAYCAKLNGFSSPVFRENLKKNYLKLSKGE